jgi:hypothetical protein
MCGAKDDRYQKKEELHGVSIAHREPVNP